MYLSIFTKDEKSLPFEKIYTKYDVRSSHIKSSGIETLYRALMFLCVRTYRHVVFSVGDCNSGQITKWVGSGSWQRSVQERLYRKFRTSTHNDRYILYRLGFSILWSSRKITFDGTLYKSRFLGIYCGTDKRAAGSTSIPHDIYAILYCIIQIRRNY